MPNADFFARLGLFVVRAFFGPELCARLRAEVREASHAQATVSEEGGSVVDENARRTKGALVSDEMQADLEARLLAIKPLLERHFGVVLGGCQTPQFLVYTEGCFYHPHRDSRTAADAPQYSRERQVTVVIFLNSQTEHPGHESYGGGSLTFYGLMADPRLAVCGVPLIGEEGLLVAFRSEMIHEVAPVTGGERYTIVSWFF
jgi:predicted 2-oxoglutarate/Fe(II)-dependent dioxygenase YbiX